MRSRLNAARAVAVLAAVAACAPGGAAAAPGPGGALETRPPNASFRPAFPNQTRAPRAANSVPVQTTVVARGLENPWSLEFLPDGRMLVSEKPGRLRIVKPDGSISPPVAGVPDVDTRGQGGLLDVAVDPQFATNRTLFFSFAEPRGDGTNGTSLARARLVEGPTPHLEGLQVIFRQQPKVASTAHFGGRLVFDRDGLLFVTLGDRYDRRDDARTLDTHHGKIVRITDDGRVPPGNPFVGRRGALHQSGAGPGGHHTRADTAEHFPRRLVRAWALESAGPPAGLGIVVGSIRVGAGTRLAPVPVKIVKMFSRTAPSNPSPTSRCT